MHNNNDLTKSFSILIKNDDSSVIRILWEQLIGTEMRFMLINTVLSERTRPPSSPPPLSPDHHPPLARRENRGRSGSCGPSFSWSFHGGWETTFKKKKKHPHLYTICEIINLNFHILNTIDVQFFFCWMSEIIVSSLFFFQ